MELCERHSLQVRPASNPRLTAFRLLTRLSSLCAGSIAIFSLYGHLFQTQLQYDQYQINAISIASGLGQYLPVPLFGILVDRQSPRLVSIISALLFAFGYTLAAFVYRSGPASQGGLPVPLMVLAFVSIGMGTCSMYLAATAACVKNFGRGRHRGLALALPIASFGLSGIWESQVGSFFFQQEDPDGTRGDVDIFGFFCFLAVLLFSVGVIGAFLQKVVDEDEIIAEAVDDLERSGLLGDDGEFHARSVLYDARTTDGYGTMTAEGREGSTLSPPSDAIDRDSGKRVHKILEKIQLLNGETRLFISDPTMWFLALGFFLLSGPVETYINNLATLLITLYPPHTAIPKINGATTHVAFLSLASALGRLGFGSLSDVVAPRSSTRSLSDSSASISERPRITISRVTLLLGTNVCLILGFLLLLTLPSPYPPPPMALAATTFLGLANGGSFSLIPIIVSTIWGVSNFATNFGIVVTMPALGATIWSALYSVEYQHHAGPDGMCYGKECYAGVGIGILGAALASAASWAWAKWGKGGWAERGVLV